MGDVIRFDFNKAQSLIDLIEDCKRVLDEASHTLDAEGAGAETWWKGVSFDAFREEYLSSGNGKALVNTLADKTGNLGRYLGKVSSSKKELDRNISNYFR